MEVSSFPLQVAKAQSQKKLGRSTVIFLVGSPVRSSSVCLLHVQFIRYVIWRFIIFYFVQPKPKANETFTLTSTIAGTVENPDSKLMNNTYYYTLFRVTKKGNWHMRCAGQPPKLNTTAHSLRQTRRTK